MAWVWWRMAPRPASCRRAAAEGILTSERQLQARNVLHGPQIEMGVFGPVSASEPAPSFGALTLEESSLGVVRLGWLTAKLEEHADLQKAASGFQAWLLERKRQREEDLLCLAAEARYLAFTLRDPDLSRRLELQEIAAFLRITPVALSRIRRRLRLRGDLSKGLGPERPSTP